MQMILLTGLQVKLHHKGKTEKWKKTTTNMCIHKPFSYFAVPCLMDALPCGQKSGGLSKPDRATTDTLCPTDQGIDKVIPVSENILILEVGTKGKLPGDSSPGTNHTFSSQIDLLCLLALMCYSRFSPFAL